MPFATRAFYFILLLTGGVAFAAAVVAAEDNRADGGPADTILLGGKIITLDEKNSLATALAVRDGRIVAVGDDRAVERFRGPKTQVEQLGGKTVIPGVVAAHCHAVGVARNSLTRPHAELLSVAEVQDWVRRRAKELPAGTWIRIPRTDITRMAERRHPTTAELDEACATHPVIFTAARKHALNSAGWVAVGGDAASPQVAGGRVIVDASGGPRLLAGGGSVLQKLMPRPVHAKEDVVAALRRVHTSYNAVGITSIFERAASMDDFLLYRQLRQQRQLSVRMTQTFRSRFRSAADVEAFTKRLAMKTGDGDEWVRVGPLKITVDGGIHWGNTYLREEYGARRIGFYAHDDPSYRGDVNYSAELMTEVFRAGHELGWQWCCHVTGDAGVDRVLESLAAVHATHPDIAGRRFSLTHAYFPATDSIEIASKLGVCVDTQSSLYYKDSAAIDEVYGRDWSSRFIGLGDWIRGGVTTAIAGDHMIGLDPNQSMNAYNPFLMLYVAVARKNRDGDVFGAHQKLSRLEALRCVTSHPAYLEFTERQKGSLELNKFADLAVLDRNYLTCPEEQIRQIQVEMTMLDGQVVYRRKK
ncbi:MAG: amidohydrolase [Pirellulaceae bacterium]|jgi:hypothetical protein|nr:amidohydrolase [Pirellulaceae bacterium]MDP7014544.1 amidohydrolase [Pirellulaceae bacterium]